MFAFKMSKSAGQELGPQDATWRADSAALYAVCTRSSWGPYGDCQADGIQCWDGGGTSWYRYNCDYL